MRSIVSTAAVLIGLVIASAANSAPLKPNAGVTNPNSVTKVACKTVKKTVLRNGKRVVTTTEDCGRERRRVYRNGRYYYEGEPGFNLGIQIR